MNTTIEKYARNQIKQLLAQCNEEQQMIFKRMYSHRNLDLPIDAVVDNMPVEKLDWALSQCECTIDKNKTALRNVSPEIMTEMRIMYDYDRRKPEWPMTVPFSLLSESMAQLNHSQTLQRLNKRGGLSPYELYCNMEGKRIDFSQKRDFYSDDKWVPHILQKLQTIKAIISEQKQPN